MEAIMRSGSLVLVAFLAAACGNGGGSGSGAGGNGSNGGGVGGSGGGTVPPNYCPGSPGGNLIANALCLCGDLRDIGNFVVDANSPTASGSIGVNGASTLINHLDVAGSYVAYGGLSDAGDTVVHESLTCAADVGIAGNVEVTHDLSVGGNLSGFGRVAVAGTLRVGGADQMIGFQQIAAKGGYTAPALPCPCDPASLFDVAGAIAAAKASSSTTVLATLPSGTIGVQDIELPSGVYYQADAATIGYERLHVTGAVSLYVDGRLDEIGADRIVIDPGASLDLYVAGSVNTVGYAGLGDKSAPAAFTLYIGGSDPVTVSIGAQFFHGSIYAPRANIVYIGDTHIQGGLFANQLSGTGQLVIGGQVPFSTSGGGCPPTPVGQPTPSPTSPIQ
jgi:hypothetical protein